VILKPGRDAALRRLRHPWIYSQGISEANVDPDSGEPARVVGDDGNPLGWGLYSPNSLIAVRLVSFGSEPPGERWLEERMEAAHLLRSALGLDSDAYRLVNAEGDFIPGLIVDIYGDTAVIAAHVRGIEALVDRVAAAIRELLPETKVYLKRDEHYARVEGLRRVSGYLAGNGDGTTVIREGGLKILVDFKEGQKTGYYLDQRENRRLAASLARGKTVLNLFSYTGGFALQTVSGGALKAVSVESSQHAVEISKKSMELNPALDPGAFEWRRGDAFDVLGEQGSYQMIVVDPPPFARRRTEVEGAIKGYIGVNLQALKLLAPGGFLLTFSCSGAVDRLLFRQALVEAALRSGRQARFIRELHADADHPVAASHAEGEYLKGWLIHAQ
jgi:23S rRNA (cytosine1962-C5)-methyltransferase